MKCVPVLALVLAVGSTTIASAGTPRADDPIIGARTAFGRAVAVSGDYAFVGEPSTGGRGGPFAGSVHVYKRGPTGWKEVDKILAPASAPGDAFGLSLAADGATLLISRTPLAVRPGADTSQGTVFAYKRGADGKWAPAGEVGHGMPGSQFGAAIALSGASALIGSPADSGGGSVRVFRRNQDGSWSAAGVLPANGLVAGDRFGASIAVDGDRAVVGAPARKLKGAVFVFKRGADGMWTQETEQIGASTLRDNSQFGAAVAVKGDRVFAGAPAANIAAPVAPTPAQLAQIASIDSANRKRALDAGQPVPPSVATTAVFGPPVTAGTVVAFERAKSGSWRNVGSLLPMTYSSERFGSAIAMVGDELWVGAPGSDGIGRIYRAKQDKEGNWTSLTKMVVDSLDPNSGFATTFAVSGDVAVVGMPTDGGGGGTVAFLAKSPTGNWTLKNTSFPPVKDQYAAVSGKELKCTDGKAQDFECKDTGLLSYMPISAIGGKRGVGLSGNWGWTDPVTGHDIAIIGRTDGTAFVDVTDPIHPKYLGDLMRTKGTPMTSWREIKTYKNYALIVSDASPGHGIQFFDLTRLRTVKTPQHFTEDSHYDLGAIHDIVVNEGSGFAYAVGVNNGGESCGGGLHMVDIHDPLHPKFAGCFADVGTGRQKTGYTHDAQCVMYHGPDKRYTNHEVCMSSNETTLSIQDVTDKKNIKVISHADYPTVGYTHQGWFTDDHKYFYLDDELDESNKLGKSAEGTRTMIFDMTDLESPILKKEYIGPTKAIDHNQYVKGNRLFQSNYKAGLRILDITDPLNPREVSFLQTFVGPVDATFAGSWNNYPFFKNGAIGVSSMQEGFFLVKDRSQSTVP